MPIVSAIDLGKVNDVSALACLDQHPAPHPVAKRRWRYDLVWLEAWELGTPYTAITAAVKARFASPRLRGTRLGIDAGGVGQAVLDIVRAAKIQARIVPILSTSGHTVSTPEETKDGSFHVPKVELVGTLIALLQAGLIRWDVGSLPAAAKLEKQLLAYRETITRAKNRTFDAPSGQHDDLVAAVANAAWLGERTGGLSLTPETVRTGRPSAFAGGPEPEEGR